MCASILVIRVLLSYDYHNVLDCCWTDTHDFRERILTDNPHWIHLTELVLSFSGAARAEETQRALQRELLGMEFIRSGNPTGRAGNSEILQRLRRQRNCAHIGHVDDRDDICTEIRAAGLAAFHLPFASAWLSELAPAGSRIRDRWSFHVPMK